MTVPENATTAQAPPATNGTGPANADADADAASNGTPEGPSQPSYAAGARVLSVGIASTGIFTFLYPELLQRPRPLDLLLAGHQRIDHDVADEVDAPRLDTFPS